MGKISHDMSYTINFELNHAAIPHPAITLLYPITAVTIHADFNSLIATSTGWNLLGMGWVFPYTAFPL